MCNILVLRTPETVRHGNGLFFKAETYRVLDCRPCWLAARLVSRQLSFWRFDDDAVLRLGTKGSDQSSDALYGGWSLASVEGG